MSVSPVLASSTFCGSFSLSSGLGLLLGIDGSGSEQEGGLLPLHELRCVLRCRRVYTSSGPAPALARQGRPRIGFVHVLFLEWPCSLRSKSSAAAFCMRKCGGVLHHPSGLWAVGSGTVPNTKGLDDRGSSRVLHSSLCSAQDPAVSSSSQRWPEQVFSPECDIAVHFRAGTSACIVSQMSQPIRRDSCVLSVLLPFRVNGAQSYDFMYCELFLLGCWRTS